MGKKLLLVRHTEILPEERSRAEAAGFETICLEGDWDAAGLVASALEEGCVGIWAGSAQVAGAVLKAQRQLGLPTLSWRGEAEPLLALQGQGLPVVPAFRVTTEEAALAAST